MEEFRLINEHKNVGVWVTNSNLLHLIKITKGRNREYHELLISWYEILNSKKFEYRFLK